MDDAPTIDEADKSTAEARPPRDPANLLGERVAGRYRVIECIGKGGMGVVYRARQESLDRDVVIKVLPESFLEDPKAVARFEREARGMSRLEHPHVVSTYDFGRTDELAFICMEYARGDHLGKRLREGPIALEEFGPIAAQILDGVSEAHSRGLVHRDIKPSNIMLCERRGYPNWVKLLDFGLAKLVRGSRDDVTSDHKLIGTLSFLSPEQILGEPIDERVDVYALGVLFYVMLSGKKPFTGATDYDVIKQHVEAEPPPLSRHLPRGAAVPDEVPALIHRSLAKKPAERPDDALEFGYLLRRATPRGMTDLPWASTGAPSWVTRSDTAPTRESPSPAAADADEADERDSATREETEKPEERTATRRPGERGEGQESSLEEETDPTAERPWPEELEPTAQMVGEPGEKEASHGETPSGRRAMAVAAIAAGVIAVGLAVFWWIL